MEGLSTDPVRILICDDYFLIREGLKSVLARVPGVEVVADTESAEEALKIVDDLLPDVVIMDIMLPGIDGIQATRLIKQNNPSVAVVALTRYDDLDHIMEIYRSGASAYLVKGVGAEELVRTVRAVCDGSVVLHPMAADAVIRSFRQAPSVVTDPGHPSLSTREVEVLRLVARGLSNKEIARDLGISLRTAQNHLGNIFRKLELNDRVSATLYAINEGIAVADEENQGPTAGHSSIRSILKAPGASTPR